MEMPLWCDGPRGSAAVATADSDGKSHLPIFPSQKMLYSSHMQYDFVAFGDIVIDAFIKLQDAEELVNHGVRELCVRFGEKVPFESVTEVLSVGNGPNAAVAAHKLGLTSRTRCPCRRRSQWRALHRRPQSARCRHVPYLDRCRLQDQLPLHPPIRTRAHHSDQTRALSVHTPRF